MMSGRKRDRERERKKKRKREGRGRERHRERQREICVALLYLKTNVHCAGLRGFPSVFLLTTEPQLIVPVAPWPVSQSRQVQEREGHSSQVSPLSCSRAQTTLVAWSKAHCHRLNLYIHIYISYVLQPILYHISILFIYLLYTMYIHEDQSLRQHMKTSRIWRDFVASQIWTTVKSCVIYMIYTYIHYYAYNNCKEVYRQSH